MTTASWSTVLDQTTDAAFRTWGSELNTKFAAVGMVQTADTGQINWTTAVRAAINTAAGYEIWRLSSSNLFFKIEYGSGSAQTNPSFWITVGTGSNGSGTLTGQLSSRTQISQSTTSVVSTVTNYQSWLCATANYFGLSWKVGSGVAQTARLFLTAMQTVDNTGAANSIGYFVTANVNNASCLAQCVATTAGVTGSAATTQNFYMVFNNISGAPASSQDGSGNNQAFLWWFSILGTAPMAPLLHAASILNADLTQGSTASMTLVGSTPHTYIAATKTQEADISNILSAGALQYIMIWE